MKVSNTQSVLDAFHELSLKDDLKLEAVYQRVEDGCREVVALKFSEAILAISVEGETDTVEVRFQEAETFDFSGMDCVIRNPPWASLLGKSFGWGWVTINQQGYQDGVLLSFDGLEPSVLLTAAATSLRISALSELAD